MYEDSIIINENHLDLLKILLKNGGIDKLNKENYKINYFGDKNKNYLEFLINNYPIDNINDLQDIQIDEEDERNYIIYIKYKDIYIGGISIFDFKSRQGFGLNKYINNENESFYIGQWEENQKNGIGFIKIDNNHLYYGNFEENQINGDGLYYNKENENCFYGIFNKGEYKQGLYMNKDIYYLGKFINYKKNDNFAISINYKKKIIYIGQIENDIFINGYIIIIKIEETKNNMILKIRKIIKKNKDEYSRIIIGKNKNLENKILTIPKIIDKLRIIMNNIKELLKELENIYNDNIYNNRIGRYNSTKNSFSFENELIQNYENYSNMLNNIKNEMDIQNLKYNIE